MLKKQKDKLVFLSVIVISVGFLWINSDVRAEKVQDASPIKAGRTKTPAQWTFLVYLDGDNNLEQEAINDFLEMASVASNADVKIVVLFDRIPGQDNSYGDWTDGRRGMINLGDVPDKLWGESLGEINMGDPQTLVDFVKWGIQCYPASKYAVVIWNHGNGWRTLTTEKHPLLKGICLDETSNDGLYMKEVGAALKTIATDNQKLDLVGFDACLMGMVEVAHEIHEYANVMVGSPDDEPGDGWPYDTSLADLMTNPSMSAAELGGIIVTRYYESYGNDRTQAAIDLTQIGALTSEIDLFSQTLRDNWNVDVIACATAAEDVITAINSAVIAEEHGTYWPGSHGLAIYFPQTIGQFDTDYNASVILFAQDTYWDEFLHDFYNFIGTPSWLANARAQSQEYSFPEHIDLYDFCEKVVSNVPDDLTVEPQDDFISAGGAGGPFIETCKTYTLINNGNSGIDWDATWNTTWLDIEPTSGTLNPADSIDVTVCLNENSNALPTGVYTDKVYFYNLVTGISQMRKVVLKIGQIDYFTELFHGDNDLDNLTITFVPDESDSFYYACVDVATEFPTSPIGGRVLRLRDDNLRKIHLRKRKDIQLYGVCYNSLYIGSNGYLTFTAGSTNWQESLTSHLLLPRISGLYVDLDPSSGGEISWLQLEDRIAVTYENVPQLGIQNENSFQIEMFFDGKIRITWLGIATNYGLTGLSQGNGIPTDFMESDISSYGVCGVLR